MRHACSEKRNIAHAHYLKAASALRFSLLLYIINPPSDQDSISLPFLKMVLTFLTVLFVTAIKFCVFCNPDGVPIEACSTLTPIHGLPEFVSLCTVNCPYTLTLAEIDMSSSAVATTRGRYMCGSTHTSKMSSNWRC